MPQTDQKSVPEDLRKLVADVMDVEEESVSDDAHFIEDLGVDSLMALEIMVALEKKYHVKFTEPELRKITCMRNVSELLDAKQAGADA